MDLKIQKEREVIFHYFGFLRNDFKDILSGTYLGGVSNVSF